MNADLDRVYALLAEGRSDGAIALPRAVWWRRYRTRPTGTPLLPPHCSWGAGDFGGGAEHARLAAERAWNDPFTLVRSAAAAWHADAAAAKVYLGRVDELTGWARSSPPGPRCGISRA